MNILRALMLILAVNLAGLWPWLWFMIRQPERWASLVERENAFWVRRGIISPAFAEKMKRFEKGRGQKLLVGTVAVLGSLGLVTVVVLAAVRPIHPHRGSPGSERIAPPAAA